MAKMAKITPWLWFDDEAEAAAKYYTGIFKKSKILHTTYYSSVGPRPEGMVMTVTFELEGQQLVALNGGPEFTFTEAISFQVLCDSQKEVDEMWSKLSAGVPPTGHEENRVFRGAQGASKHSVGHHRRAMSPQATRSPAFPVLLVADVASGEFGVY